MHLYYIMQFFLKVKSHLKRYTGCDPGVHLPDVGDQGVNVVEEDGGDVGEDERSRGPDHQRPRAKAEALLEPPHGVRHPAKASARADEAIKLALDTLRALKEHL
ncbi:hypothetical protein NDU88_005883 [Pleurodeles waltl]|uniref:Uncharacterized protein n=1 Tax=Pleurodeles waltl TaxID=8319 RepID=A0AAV7QG39_PLEWA|nr:hypothetical protein NDU88_005883 [Pleurodeles waltl]